MIITYSIIAITVLISFYAFNEPGAMRNFIMNPYLADTHHQYYRFITSGFIHKDYVHLLWNMLSLYFFGGVVEAAFEKAFLSQGPLYFILFYLIAIIVSDVPTFFRQKDNPRYNTLGASGGVSAILFASIIFQPIMNICLYGILCLPGFILGTLFLIGSYYQGKNSRSNINHDAHLFGALFGFLFCIIMYPGAFFEFIQQIANWKPASLWSH